MSKIDLEVSDNLEFDDGDCAVIIKEDPMARGDKSRIRKYLWPSDAYAIVARTIEP